MSSSIEIRYFLNELASYGYIAIAIGPYDEDDFFAHWTSVMKMMYPSNKEVVLAEGTVVKPVTREELEVRPDWGRTKPVRRIRKIAKFVQR